MTAPQMTPYKDALTDAMTVLAEKNDILFIGQQIVYSGNPMSTTLVNVSKDKMIELPVMEETQMGMSLGLAMAGKTVVSFYPRWDFVVSATNQLVNHLDKYEVMTGNQAHIIIRLGKGSDKPLDPGHQHKGSYFDEFKSLCPNIKFYDLKSPAAITEAYKTATEEKGIHVLVEYPELYYTN
jgi:pyruvate/2-oxoglutarate/acetoin dehydrogenase E1 component